MALVKTSPAPRAAGLTTPANPTEPAQKSSRLAAAFGPVARPLAWYAASRLLFLVATTVAIGVRSDLSRGNWAHLWDAKWFLQVIEHGYPSTVPAIAGDAVPSRLAFFPLFPLLTRGLAWLLPGPDAVAAVAVALIFGGLSVVLLFHLARSLTDDATARRAVALFCFFPGSIVLSMAYSEPVMIALAAACLLALHQRSWLTAGLTAALATATRPNAIALVAACVWCSWRAVRDRREWRSLLAPLLAPTGMLAFFAFLWSRTGEAGAWFRVQREGWGQQFDLGRHTLGVVSDFLRHLADPLGYPARTVVVVCLAFLIVSVVILARQRRLPGFVIVYTLVVAALAAMSTIDIVRPRAILTAFPLFIALAGAVARPRAFRLLVATFASGMVLIVLFPYWGSP